MSMKHKNDYYKVSNDNITILDEEPSVNDKPSKVHNVFSKFMIAIVVWFLVAFAIFCPIAAYSYYKTHSMFMWPIPILGLVLALTLPVAMLACKKY